MDTDPTDDPGASTPFEIRWRGYDCGQVEAFVREAGAAQQRLQSRIATLEASHTVRHQEQADDIVALARRHAEEIRGAAEQEAHRLLREAETRAAQLQNDRLQSQQRQADAMGALHRDIEWCLSTITAALGHVRELTAPQAATTAPAASDAGVSASPAFVPPSSEGGAAPSTGTEASTAVPPVTLNAAGTEHRRVRGAAAIWSVLMGAIVLMLMMRPAWPLTKATSSVAVPPDLQSAGAVVEPVPGGTDEATPVAAAAEPPTLTVTFVAMRDCWISVDTDGSGPRERLLRPSDTYIVRAREVVTVKAGNAAALSLLINDRPTRPLGREGQVVTRRITLANYRSLLETSERRAST